MRKLKLQFANLRYYSFYYPYFKKDIFRINFPISFDIFSDLDFRDVEGPYTSRFYQLSDLRPQEWGSYFTNWSYMRLRRPDQIQRDRDFVLVSNTAWMKLSRFFGGAPEISFYLVDKKLLSSCQLQQALGASEDSDSVKEVPDLEPIALQAVNVDCQEATGGDLGGHSEFQTVLVSKHIGVKNFINSISSQFNYAPTKVNLFKAWIEETKDVNGNRFREI